ncbi:MAG: phenylacetate--CoA ligase family protein [Acidobacteria bacterium]|nr:phenylacetate--CoA ligase family protein [Acidobacteriota bacterium]
MVHRPDLETVAPDVIRDRQLARLNELLAAVLPRNAFYARKFGAPALPLSWEAFRALPFTTKAELVADQEAWPPFGAIATYPPECYVGYHQTSGTTGRPLVVLDTAENWDWWAECWQYVYAAAGVTARDRIFFAFSFGPFIGFWSAHAGARRIGAMVIPGGGLDSKARLELLLRMQASVLVCTLTYALRLAEVAREEGLSIRDSAVRVTIHAGEPGASIPPVRARIEEAWGARAFDHAGGTEIGAYGFACELRDGLHVNEAEFIAAVLDPATGEPCAEGSAGELVITNLGRAGWPVIRYRTGDVVTVGTRRCTCGRTFLTLPGGIAGRTDDLIILRGVNVYPSAVEAIVRTFPVEEFRLVRTRSGALDELTVEVETASEAIAAELARVLRERLAVRIPTRAVPVGSLPRWELKARRLVDAR